MIEAVESPAAILGRSDSSHGRYGRPREAPTPGAHGRSTARRLDAPDHAKPRPQQVAPLPPCHPNLNAYAERFVHSVENERLGNRALLGESHLHTVVREYVAHYPTPSATTRALEGRLIEPPANDSGTGSIDCRERLGGLLRFYHRQAA